MELKILLQAMIGIWSPKDISPIGDIASRHLASEKCWFLSDLGSSDIAMTLTNPWKTMTKEWQNCFDDDNRSTKVIIFRQDFEAPGKLFEFWLFEVLVKMPSKLK